MMSRWSAYYLPAHMGDSKWAGVFERHVRTNVRGANYLFADGHVRGLRAIQTLKPVWLWGPCHWYSNTPPPDDRYEHQADYHPDEFINKYVRSEYK